MKIVYTNAQTHARTHTHSYSHKRSHTNSYINVNLVTDYKVNCGVTGSFGVK